MLWLPGNSQVPPRIGGEGPFAGLLEEAACRFPVAGRGHLAREAPRSCPAALKCRGSASALLPVGGKGSTTWLPGSNGMPPNGGGGGFASRQAPDYGARKSSNHHLLLLTVAGLSSVGGWAKRRVWEGRRIQTLRGAQIREGRKALRLLPTASTGQGGPVAGRALELLRSFPQTSEVPVGPLCHGPF